MHDSPVGMNVSERGQHFWIYFMKTIIFLEPVAEICYKEKHNVGGQNSTLSKWWC